MAFRLHDKGRLNPNSDKALINRALRVGVNPKCEFGDKWKYPRQVIQEIQEAEREAHWRPDFTPTKKLNKYR